MPSEILDGMFQIVLPTPFPVGPVNCYVTTREPIVLIDTGTHWQPTRSALLEQLDELDLKLTDIQQIVITHPHADHFGLAAEIVRLGGAQVWTHPLNRQPLDPNEEFVTQRNRFYEELLFECGVPDDERSQFFESRSKSRPYWEPVGTDHCLEEGDIFRCADRDWKVFHTPGHAGGLICLYNEADRILLSNDHLLRRISSNPIIEPDPDGGPRPHRLVQYLQQLQRIADLEPRIAWTGHGDVIPDVPRTVRQRFRYHQRRSNNILEMLRGQQMSAHQIATRLFGLREGFDCFLAISETIGHLDWLKEQGRVETFDRQGIVYWSPSGDSHCTNSDTPVEQIPI
jgi:glyoxylase-like metal-dependent hydrolase (beta-lactamase superfamily II)